MNFKSNCASTLLFKSNLLKRFLVIIMVILSFSNYSAAQENSKGDLIINVNGIRNQKGKIRVSVYDSADGFPGTPQKAKYLAEGIINKSTAQIKIENLPFGEYAVSLIHDENNNLKVETNFLGIPKEGIGMSNDAKGTFGPPSYTQAKFKYAKKNQIIKINIVYY